MNRSVLITQWVTRLSWGVLLLNIFIIFVIPGNSFRTWFQALAYLGWLLVTFCLASIWLAISYRQFFQKLPGWIIAPVIVAVITYFMFGYGTGRLHPKFSFLFSTILIPSLCFLFFTTVVLLWRRDIGLSMFGWFSILIIWSLFFFGRDLGNPMEIWLQGLEQPDAPTPLWWLYTLCSLVPCILPLAIVSFFVHTLRLVKQELL